MLYIFYLCCVCVIQLEARDSKNPVASPRTDQRNGRNLFGVLGFLSGYRLGQGLGYQSNSHLNLFGKTLDGDLHISYRPFGHMFAAAAHNEIHQVPGYYPQFAPLYNTQPYQAHPPIFHHPGPPFPVPGSAFPAPGSPFPVPGPPFPVPGPTFPVPGPTFPVPGAAFPGPGFYPQPPPWFHPGVIIHQPAPNPNRPTLSHPNSSPLNQQQIVNIHEPLNANDPPQDNYQEVRDINRQQIVNRLPETSRPPGPTTLREGPEGYDSNVGQLYEESDGDQSSSEKSDDRLEPTGSQEQRGMQPAGPFRQLFNRLTKPGHNLFKTPVEIKEILEHSTLKNTSANERRESAGGPRNPARMKVSVQVDQPGRPTVFVQNQNIHSKPHKPSKIGMKPKPGGSTSPNRQMPPQDNGNPSSNNEDSDYEEEEMEEPNENGDTDDTVNGSDNDSNGQNINNNGIETTTINGEAAEDNESTTISITVPVPSEEIEVPTTTTIRPATGYGPPSPINQMVSITRPSPIEVPAHHPFKPSYQYVYDNYLSGPEQHHHQEQPIKVPGDYVHGKAPWTYVPHGPDNDEYGLQPSQFGTFPEYPGPYHRDAYGRAKERKEI